MSLNVTLVTWDYIVCASDRRITRMAGHDTVVLSERSNKLTHFQCRGAEGFVTYNGVGWDPNFNTPSDWISEIDLFPHVGVDGFISSLKRVMQERVRALPPTYPDRRHTFVVPCFLSGIPSIYLVSNYERLDSDKIRMVASVESTIEGPLSILDLKKAHSARLILVTGATDSVPKPKLAEGGSRIPHMNSEMAKRWAIKAIRDASFAQRNREKRRTVGTSVTWGVITRGGGCEVGCSVIGGTSIQEMPNFWSPTVKTKGIHFGSGPAAEHLWEHGMQTVPELSCTQCGSLVPLGYTRCANCEGSVQV